VSKARLSVSSWSLHKSLGSPAFYGVGEAIPIENHNRGRLSLLELPQAVADFGISTLELVHFHLPSRDDTYLADLKAALSDANVELFSLLIDDGDIVHPVDGERDRDWIEGWLEVAAKLGSRSARVIAGKQPPTPETLSLSISRLGELAAKAEASGLRLMTENWFETTSTVEAVTEVMERLRGRVGLCLDFGNWKGADKYERFEHVVKYAESCHTKAFFSEGVIDKEDYERCLTLTQKANFSGPHTLIFDSPEPSDWEGLEVERTIVQRYL